MDKFNPDAMILGVLGEMRLDAPSTPPRHDEAPTPTGEHHDQTEANH